MNLVCEAPNPIPMFLPVPEYNSDDERRGDKIKIPDMENEIDEVLRLMRRKPSEKEHESGCLVCGGGDHFEERCPCFKKIPPGVELDWYYDQVCIGCGRIGVDCCSKGTYAVIRGCGACGRSGHWYWDDKCGKDFVHDPDTVELSIFKDKLSAEQSSMQNKEEDQNMVDLGKDNKNEDDYGKEGDGAKVIFDDERREDKIKIPDMEDDVDEVLRLMRRKPAEKEHESGCLVCGGGDHFEERCPCFKKIPPGVELDWYYDQVCIGCGRIGVDCCSKGTYAVIRGCGACGRSGHWYWDDKCGKDFVHDPDTVELSIFKDKLSAEQSSVQNKEEYQNMVDLGKDNKNEDDYGKEGDGAKVIFDDERREDMIKIPDMVDDVDEVLRLMRRKPAEREYEYGCLVCGSENHFEECCPCLKKIPLGVELDRFYDQVCIGCGRIGEDCCSKGTYAVIRRCGACGRSGHWYWGRECDKDFVHDPNTVELPFFKDILSAEQSSMQNKEEDQNMVDLGKDNKNEDDYGKEGDGAKGGNESSDRSRFKAISESGRGMIHVICKIGRKRTIDEAGFTTEAGSSWSEDVNAVKSNNPARSRRRQGYQG